MAVINDPNVAANIAGVGEVVQVPLHVVMKPHKSAAGHYRSSARFLLAAAQVAGSRVWYVKNPHASLLLVPTRLVVRYVQSAVGTAQDNSLDLVKCTGYVTDETTNIATPVTNVKRGSMSPSAAATIKQVTGTGVAAGMTGAARVTAAGPFASVPISVQAAVQPAVQTFDLLDDVNGTHPWVFVQNEGIEIQNRVLNVTSYGVMVYIDFSWIELTAF